MLAENLSNGICSLVPNKDRLTFSVIFEVTKRGKIVNFEFVKSLINSNIRFTFEQVQEIIESGNGDFADEIILLNNLAKTLRKKRIKEGGKNMLLLKYSEFMRNNLLLYLIAFVFVFGLNDEILAQQDTTAYVTDQHDLQKDTEPEQDINNSIPQRDYLLFPIMPQSYTQFKNNLYDKTGIKFGLSYQTLFQHASESLTETNTAWGGWFIFEIFWVAFNKDKDYQGKFILTLDDRHIINSSQNQAPGFFRLDIGSLWATDVGFLKWNIYPATILWEQVIKKDRLEFRVGQFGALSTLDFFRFADPRTSYSNSQLSAPVALIPISPPGFGMSVKWWPIKDSELYVVGLFNDINAEAGKVDWSGIFEFGEVFAGAEVGYNVLRSKEDFDHVHFTIWYGDKISSRPYPTRSGWGFKLHGSKQWKRIVAFGNYAYNTSEGGGFSYTNTQRAINLGAAYLKLFNVKGELALAASWAQPIDKDLRNQFGIETYWKLLLGSDLWVTPGTQLIWNPSQNQSTNFIFIPQIKARLFL